jgi:glucuronate isomerase
MKSFMTEDFLLQNDTAIKLYHDFAKAMPIFDYHCHISPQEIAEDKQFATLTEIWLADDHYKWRAMRFNGVNERFCTGDASDWEKFEKWAETVPYTIRNPLYHWTHLELKNTFGIEGKLLGPDTAREIYDQCTEMLQSSDFSCKQLIKKANVKVICTTDDPIDSLGHHTAIAGAGGFTKVLPAWRPDNALAVECPKRFNGYVDKLVTVSGVVAEDFAGFLKGLKNRHQFFHDAGCRISDRGIEKPYADDYSDGEIVTIYKKIRTGTPLAAVEIGKFKSAMMFEFAIMDHEKGWAQQLHLGALRNNNTRLLTKLGPNTGFDSIGDFEMGVALSKYLNRLDTLDKLSKTILYNLNPRDNELFASMIGNYQDGTIPGKMQYGTSWWFLDQKDGMERQMNALSNLGLLSRFIGMLTDSRSFLSYSRHEYFRRILCNLIGTDVENGELPNEIEHLGGIVKDICFNNAVDYFGISA